MKARIARLALVVTAGAGLGFLAAALRNSILHIGNIDFDVFYQSGLAWRRGRDLYVASRAFPNLNPPQFAVIFSPLTVISPLPALLAWQAINIGCALTAAVIIVRELQLPQTFATFVGAVAAAGLTTGLQLGFEEGQLIGVVTLGLTATWRAARHQKWVSAGILLGIVVSIKPFFACFLLVPLWRPRQWPLIAWTCAAALAAVITGVALAGIESFRRWLEVGRHVSWFNNPMNASLMGLMSRAGLGWDAWLPFASLLGLVTLLAVRRGDDFDADWLLCGTTSLLVSPLGWVYYVPVVAGAFAAVALQRPLVLLVGVGLLWPVLRLSATAPITRWTAVTALSLPFWSLFALWSVAAVRGVRAPPSMSAWRPRSRQS